MTVTYVESLTDRIDLSLFGTLFTIKVLYDKIYGSTTQGRRIYIQLEYLDKCSKTNKIDRWKSRKWYLSDYMTDDEIIKTCYLAFEVCVKHEILENFKVDGKALFNPHHDYSALLKIKKERKR